MVKITMVIWWVVIIGWILIWEMLFAHHPYPIIKNLRLMWSRKEIDFGKWMSVLLEEIQLNIWGFQTRFLFSIQYLTCFRLLMLLKRTMRKGRRRMILGAEVEVADVNKMFISNQFGIWSSAGVELLMIFSKTSWIVVNNGRDEAFSFLFKY